MNLAAIDIGTNSFHLIVVKVKEKGNFEIIDREKEVIRLGEGNIGDIKFITPAATQRAITTLLRFKTIADSHEAKIRAVATSAVRESLNKNEFIKKVYDQTNIEIEVISGHEEARLIYLGVLKAVPVFDQKALCIDIGGGSTEFAIGKEGKLKYSTSLKLGAVRLTRKFFPDYVVTNKRIDECRAWVEGILYKVIKEIEDIKFDTCIGSSGTIMASGLIIYSKSNKLDSQLKILNNFTFTGKDLSAVSMEILSAKKEEDRKKIGGLDPKRADIIPAGIIIFKTIIDMLKINKVTISGYALREGIIIDTLQKEKHSTLQPKLSDIRLESIKHLALSCNYDRRHCFHVSGLALQIYDQVIDRLNLKTECREYLEAATILHDIGYHIAHSQHHKHSQYIISNSEILGFNENEIRIIANIARYHRKSHPKERHKEFTVLNKQNKNIVLKLAGILRVADSMDRTHKAKIDSVRIEKQERKMLFIVHTKNSVSIDLEIWSFESRKKLFEDIFNVEATMIKED
ncbi:exopolyphosphatase [bacterium BMS3Abin04]|nr:exopolyphosphatase [bacterium BMS3Abin04]